MNAQWEWYLGSWRPGKNLEVFVTVFVVRLAGYNYVWMGFTSVVYTCASQVISSYSCYSQENYILICNFSLANVTWAGVNCVFFFFFVWLSAVQNIRKTILFVALVSNMMLYVRGYESTCVTMWLEFSWSFLNNSGTCGKAKEVAWGFGCTNFISVDSLIIEPEFFWRSLHLL